MKLFDKFMKKESYSNLEEAPLSYWEEKSYMLALTDNVSEILKEDIFKKVASIKGVKIIEKKPIDGGEPGKIKLTYEKEEYEIGFYIDSFSLPNFKMDQLSDDEIEKVKVARNALTVFMPFNKDSKKSFHLQLKILYAMVPDMLALVDESAEKILSIRWVKTAIFSSVTPGPNDLYTVQAVQAKNGDVWLHTHGLLRCGITELEILESDKKNYYVHYNIISAFASYLIDKKNEFTTTAFIGMLANKQPIVATYLSWTKALCEYKNLDLGGIKDRKSSHNSKTSVIFLFKNEEDENNKKYTKVSEFNSFWKEDPIFFISDEETFRMKSLAMERFDIVKENANKDNRIIIKIGLPTDNQDNFEHIWFELLEFKKDKFKGKLLQEPYDVKNMHEGDEAWFTVNDVTDWIIYTKEFTINPENIYLLNN